MLIEPEPRHDLPGDPGAGPVVAVEVAPSVLIHSKGLRLAQVVEEHGPAEDQIFGGGVHCVGGMIPHCVDVVGVFLVEPDGGQDLRKKFPQDGGISAKDLSGLIPHKEAVHLHKEPLRGDLPEEGGADLHGPGGGGLYGEAQPGGEPQAPHDAEGILLKAPLRVAYGPEDPRRQVTPSIEGICDAAPEIHGDGVYRKVPAGQILSERAAEGDGVRAAVVGVAAVLPEGGDLHASSAANGDGAVLEARRDGSGGKEGHDLLGQGAGSHVPIPRLPAQEHIPDSAANSVGFIAAALQGMEDLDDIFWDIADHTTSYRKEMPPQTADIRVNATGSGGNYRLRKGGGYSIIQYCKKGKYRPLGRFGKDFSMTHTTDIRTYIAPGARVHLTGIGGVSMCPLAEVLHGMGLQVQGSDMRESATVAHLRSLGIQVKIGHTAENVEGAQFLIRTAAVHDDNPEIARANALGIPVFERAQAWGAIMREYQNAVCIAGTHGKTTTTSMTTHIFMAAQTDPTVMIGGTLPLLKSGYRVGHGDTIILESCEYCNSFLHFFPTVAVVLNVEADHLDFFKDLQDVQRSFRRFAELVPESGSVLVNADDPGAMEALQGIDCFTFGTCASARCRAEHLTWENGLPAFDVVVDGRAYAHLELQVGGQHNVLNALAAASVAYVLDLPGTAVERGLADFTGAGRRFEHKGSFNGAEIYDDYAHHPGELHALLSMARSLGYKRVVAAFQPHTYTRTKALFNDFVRELQGADKVVLAEIYAAREKNTIGISSRDLAEKVPGSIYCSTLKDVEAELRRLAQPGDLILTIGAGDIYTVGEALSEN